MPCALLVLSLPAAAITQPAPNAAVIEALGDHLLTCRHEPTGVLFFEPATKRPGGLVPYFSHFAAFGLVRAYEVSPKPEYLQAADEWIDWYRAHMQPDGTVTDYKLNDDETLTSTGDMDSTDSYAAMYLWLVAERRRVAPEPAGWLQERERSCVLALSAILLTMQEGGLTIAKPDYPIEYAMDNAEVVTGLRSAGSIFDALANPGMAAHCRALADRAEAELRTFFSAEHGFFAWYRDLAGKKAWELEKWYPDVMAQVVVLMHIGTPQDPDRQVFDLIAERFLAEEFDAAKPSEHIWYGLAAQRVDNEEWAGKLLPPLNDLTPERIAEFDALRGCAVITALTGGTSLR